MIGTMKAVQARVTGRVQGVSFRWYAQEQARRLGVVGWVRNEPDGSVLLHAEGEDEAVDALVAWCRDGPGFARVPRRRRPGGGAARRDELRGDLLAQAEFSGRGCNDAVRGGHGGVMDASGDPREDVFRRLYAAHFDCVLGYALRRTSRAEDAADVTAETFLVAWRRLSHVPAGDAARPWLYGVARRQLANQRRGELRRRRLGERLRRDLSVVVPDLSDQVVQDHVVDAAMSRLSARDEEVLQLHLWEGLEPREIGEVLGLPGTVVTAAPVARPVPAARAPRQRSAGCRTHPGQATDPDP